MTDQLHIDDRIIDYVYGELDAASTRELERHVAGCAHCADEVAKLQGVRRAAMALPQLSPRAHVTAAILHRGRELAPMPVRKPSLLSWFLRPAFAGAFLFVATLGVGLYVTRSGSHDGAREEQPSASRFVAPSAPRAAGPAAAPPTVASRPASSAGTAALAGPAQAPGLAEKNAPHKAENKPTDPDPSAAMDGRARDMIAKKAPRRDRGQGVAQSPFVPRDDEAPRIIAQVARPAKEALFPSKDQPRLPPVTTPSYGGAVGGPAAPEQELARAELKADRNQQLVDDSKALAKAKNAAESELATGFARGDAQTRVAESPPAEQRVARLAEPFGNAQGGAALGGAPTPTAPGLEGALAQQAAAPSPSAPPPPAAAPAPVRPTVQTAYRSGYQRGAERVANVPAREEADDSAASGRAATEVLLARAEAEYARGDFAGAVKTLEQLFRNNPGYAAPRAFELLASAHERRGDAAKAAAVRKQAAARTRR